MRYLEIKIEIPNGSIIEPLKQAHVALKNITLGQIEEIEQGAGIVLKNDKNLSMGTARLTHNKP